MTSPSRRKPRTTAGRTILGRTAISLGLLAGAIAPAFGQTPAAKPSIPWTPYTQAAPSTAPIAPISTQPGLVPQTLSFQKTPAVPASQPALPPLGVPAIPTSGVSKPAVEVPPIEINVQAPVPPIAPAADPEKPRPLKIVASQDEVFRLEGDTVLFRRIQKELGDKKDDFPVTSPLVDLKTPYAAKTSTYPPMQVKLEPTYVVHRRLYFEDKNAERAGWDLGALQPFLSAGIFARDVFWLPHNVASGLWINRWDTSVGKCPPGSPTPYYLYPHGFTVSGLMWQAPLVTGLVFIFP